MSNRALRSQVSSAAHEVTVGGQLWQPVSSLAGHGPDARVYALVTNADGSGHLVFGDGVHGRRPPTGSPIAISYRTGAGAGGNAVVTTPSQPAGGGALALEVIPGRGLLHVRHGRHRHQ